MRLPMVPVFAATVVAASFASTAFAEEVENPAYASWAKFKPGTSVTFKISLDAAAMKQEGTITQTLIEIKPEGAVLEIKTVSSPDGQARESTTKATLPARVEKDKEYLPLNTPPNRVSVSDMKEGKETLEMKGSKIEAVTHEFTLAMTGGGRRGAEGPAGNLSQKVKAWSSPDVPGSMVKNEATGNFGPAGDVKTTMIVTDYSIVK